MPDFTFVTSNDHKVMTAQAVCDAFGVTFSRKHLDLVEIQADNGEAIGRHKAEQAFDICHTPVVISDDSWIIPGLNGFPGPYMKYMNEWLTAEDFQRLTSQLENRRIILHQVVVYKDAQHEQLFTADLEGVLLEEVRGKHPLFAHFAITSLDGGKHSLAEADTLSKPTVSELNSSYHKLCTWLKSRS